MPVFSFLPFHSHSIISADLVFADILNLVKVATYASKILKPKSCDFNFFINNYLECNFGITRKCVMTKSKLCICALRPFVINYIWTSATLLPHVHYCAYTSITVNIFFINKITWFTHLSSYHMEDVEIVECNFLYWQ